MTKRQAFQLAKSYASTVLRQSAGGGIDDEYYYSLSEKDQERLSKALLLLAEKLDPITSFDMEEQAKRATKKNLKTE